MDATPKKAPLETPLAERYRAANVNLAPYFGVLLPTRFADPADEQRLARQTAVLVDTNFRAAFSLTGPDRVRYLNAVMTNNVRDLKPNQGTIGLLLNSQGHILDELETLAFDDSILILGHAFNCEATAATLDKFIIMDDAMLTDRSDHTGMLAIEGPAAMAIVNEVAGVDLTLLEQYTHVETSVASANGAIACDLVRQSLYGFPGAEFIVARENIAELRQALEAAARKHGGAPIGYEALNALRLEAGIPWFGTDFGEHQIPHEAGLEKSHISYTKGCYTGQEIVERVRSRGHVNKRLTGLAFGGAEIPERGAALTAGGAEAGEVTSAAFSPLLGRAMGLGYVRREHDRIGEKLQCGSLSAEVIELPLPGAATKESA